VYGANGVIGRYDKFNHEEPQLLVTCRGATCGAVNVSTPYAWINGNAMVVKPKSKDVDIKFVEYFFRGAVDLTKAITGAAQPQITRQSLSPISFKYPPLPTQQKIVAKLDVIFSEIDKATASAEANAKNAEALFQSYLTQVFESKQENWVIKSLIELANDDCSLSYGIVQPGDDFENGLPIVRPTNLTKKYIPKLELKTINPILADSYKRTTLTGEELLLCVRGTTGTVSISTEELKGCNVTRGIVPIRFKTNLIDLDYAYYLFNSSVLQKQIKSKTYGAALLQINIADVKKLKLPVPKIEEQKKIVFQLDSVKS
jgi:type I restriction enzyme S subunit